MSEKNLRMSLYFLASVVVLYLISVLAGGGASRAPAGDPGVAAALESLDEASLDRMEIDGPDESLLLERADQGWTVNGFAADSAAVERLLRAIEETEVASLAATNPANHDRLGVSEDSAWALAAGGTGEGDAVRLLLGKAGPRFRTAYARLPGEDAVSAIEGDLRAAAARRLFDWRDKTVLRADTAAVARIEVTRDGATNVYERQDSVWVVDGAEADATDVRNMLQELAGLRASGFAPEGSEVPSPPSRTVRAADASGTEIVSLWLEEQEGNFLGMSSQSPYVFEVPTFRADRVAPAPAGEDESG